ncbi:MAG: hypothetical protein A3J72_02125 [Nitrospirae bacterium RIFCSPHIGHO2_02_FULL_40_19]|nr:MAG: hypothetical protein A3J72_02125 [Nitrospirae bacterium RIFCSPHIGHO2_02_FULL_40_19]
MRAAAFLDGWLRHKILLQHDKPGIYAYEQRISCRGRKMARLGFISLLRLEDFGRGKVFPHEETYPKAKLDRLQLMRAASANFESIFALYSDEKGKVTKTLKQFIKKKPLIEAKDKQNVIHRLWCIDRKSAIAKIVQEMKDKAVFIADGHHRYEAALRFRTEQKTKNTKFTEEELYNHAMMYFAPLEDKGLIILPFHRVVKPLAFFEPERFEQNLTQFFEVKPYPANRRTADKVRRKLLKDLGKSGLEKHVLGLYLGNHRYFLLTLKDETLIEEMVAEEKPKAWKMLDANILHFAVFDRLLNIAQETEDKIIYTKSDEEAVKLVDEKGRLMAFFLNPTKIEEIVAIASKLEKLPHKSTCFYPKLLSGLVLNKFEHGEKVKV